MSTFKERLQASVRDINATVDTFDSVKRRLVYYLTEISNAKLVSQAVFNKQAHLIEFEVKDEDSTKSVMMKPSHMNMYENEILVGVLTYKTWEVLEKVKTEYITALLQKLLRELESAEERLRLVHKESNEVLTWTRNKVQSLIADTKKLWRLVRGVQNTYLDHWKNSTMINATMPSIK